MKLTDLLTILAFLIIVFLGGYAWTEYQKSVTGQQDIRKDSVQKNVEKSLTGNREKLTFEQAVKHTE
jgi:apolipoprotein N-acyltransferase